MLPPLNNLPQANKQQPNKQYGQDNDDEEEAPSS